VGDVIVRVLATHVRWFFFQVMSNGTNTTRLAREELRDEFGEYLSDDDNGVVQSTLSRHRLTLSEHDRRRSMSLSYRAREHQELHDSIARLITEVDALKLQNAGITQAKVTLDAQLHIAALALLSKDNELEAARHQISELREQLAGTTEQRDELSATLERRVATQRKKQRATRLLFEWAETAARSNLDDAFHFGIAALFDVFAQGPTRRFHNAKSTMLLLDGARRTLAAATPSCPWSRCIAATLTLRPVAGYKICRTLGCTWNINSPIRYARSRFVAVANSVFRPLA
jgi:hypothetical protein